MLKIDIICGLLGVGKTTLIKRMLDTVYADKKIAIIENEVGDVNLDAGEFKRSDIKVEELTSGCVCCTLKAGFYDALRIFSGDPSVEYMLVEPSGIADITDLLDVCGNTENVIVNRKIMVVKAPRILRFLKAAGSSFRGQITEADTIYLNFSAQMESGALDEVKQELWKINPLAVIVDCPLESITVDTFPDSCNDASSSAESAGKANTPLRAPRIRKISSARADGRIRMISPAMQRNEVITTEISCPDVLEVSRLQALTEYLKALDEDSGLLRVKGYLRTSDGFITKVDLAAGDVFTKKLIEYDASRVNRLVLIGYGSVLPVEEEALTRILY